ncbi:MAG: AAA family ATPase [Verrucomicrobiota bacterium]
MPHRKTNLAEWLNALEMEAYLPLFHANEVDFETLLILSEADLKELGLPFGPRKRLLGALAEHRRRQSPANDFSPEPRVAEGLERRHLTVLFCDMVGFTDLAGRVDAETLQNIIKTYENDCSECIERFGGHILHCLGDGIVALFGFPVAHEDDADRAIRASFRIIDTLSKVPVPEVGRLRVRAGIASGLVVVSASENRAIGETLNIASRLQGIADPDTVVVTEEVRTLAGGSFIYSDLGETSLKGVARPIRIFRVLGHRSVGSRFEAAARPGPAPMVGRAEEMSRLLEGWAEAKAGRGRLYLLSGEPGIGKSRLTATLREFVEGSGFRVLSFQCSPHYGDSAFYPLLEALERALDWQQLTHGNDRLDRLESFLSGQYGRPLEDVRILGTLFSLPCQDRYGALTLTPQRRHEATIRAFVNLLDAVSKTQPALAVFEDLHWADPSTLEVLDHLVIRLPKMALQVVATARLEFTFRWERYAQAAQLPIGRLRPEDIESLVAGISVRHIFPSGLMDQIVARTDGVPLFVEELTRAILETSEGSGNSSIPNPEANDTGIPATLRDLLMARLDRVAEAKEIAQIGAVLGREFSHELISAVAPMSTLELETGLERLLAAGLAFRKGTPPDAVYQFKHALIQDAAYDSLLKSRRKELHAIIAGVLEERFPRLRDSKPELLAHHHTEAGNSAEAVRYWHRAGDVALRRFAPREAAAHLRRGLRLVESLPEGPDRDLREVELRTLLGPAVVARQGWAASEIGNLLEPALALARNLKHRQSYLPTLHGLWVNSLTLGRLARSRDWANEMLATARESSDSELEICGHRAAMTSCFWLGDLKSARSHGDVIRQLYDPARHGQIAKLTNSDPLTGDGIYRSQYLWMMGFPDQARAACESNHEHARRLNHPFDLAFALTLGSQVYEFCGESSRLLECSAEGERVGREHGVPVMSEVLAEISKGVGLLRSDHIPSSVLQLRTSVERLVGTGQRIWVSYIRALLGEALARDGKPSEGLKLIEESLAQIEAQDERPHFAEVLRLRGWLLELQGRTEEAESEYLRSLEFSRAQGARSWELRTALSLSRLLLFRGNPAAALELLEPVHSWFTEGFQTRDLRDSATFLARLGSRLARRPSDNAPGASRPASGVVDPALTAEPRSASPGNQRVTR